MMSLIAGICVVAFVGIVIAFKSARGGGGAAPGTVSMAGSSSNWVAPAVVVVLVALIGLLAATGWSSSLEAERVAKWEGRNWFLVLLITAFPLSLSMLPGLAKQGKFFSFLTCVVAAFFIKAPLSAWMNDSFNEGCTHGHPCEFQANEKLHVPEGMQPCFEESLWTNLPKLGFHYSYRKGPVMELNCTSAEVFSGSCQMRSGDTIWLEPKEGTPLPKGYWFVPTGTKEC